MPRHGAYLARLRVSYRLCDEKKRGEQSNTPLCHRGVLHQKQDQTVRPLLGLAGMRVSIVVLWRWLDEVMHKVGTRRRQEGQECQNGTERAETTPSPAHLAPPVPVACPEGIHSDTVPTAHSMALVVSSLSLRCNTPCCGVAYLVVAFGALCAVAAAFGIAAVGTMMCAYFVPFHITHGPPV